MKNFRNLKIWKEGMQIVEESYCITKNLPSEERYGLRSQLTRSAISIPSNIAEGCGREGDAELLRFLEIANGSTYELETQLEIMVKLKFTDEEKVAPLLHRIQHLQVMIHNYRNYIKQKTK